MNFISQMPFQDRFQTLFIVGSTSLLFILPEYFSNFVVFLVVSRRPKKSFPLSIAILSKIHGSSFMLSVSNYSICQIFLCLPIRSMSGVVFPFLFTGGHRSRRILRPHISATVIQLSRCFVQVFFNQLMISLFFCI